MNTSFPPVLREKGSDPGDEHTPGGIGIERTTSDKKPGALAPVFFLCPEKPADDTPDRLFDEACEAETGRIFRLDYETFLHHQRIPSPRENIPARCMLELPFLGLLQP